MGADRLGRLALDGLQYGVALTALFAMVLTPVSLTVSGDLVWVKRGLFLAGMTLMLFGAVKSRPQQRHAVADSGGWRPRLSLYLPRDTRSEDGFGGFVGRLPPAALFVRESGDRLSDGGRFLVAWLVAWTASYLMEAVFNVGVPPPLR